jgi:hypothetical protein
MRRQHIMMAVLLYALLAAATDVMGQAPAQDFGDLRSRLSIGESLIVRDSANTEIRGRLAGLSSASLSLAANGAVRDFTPDQVRAVWRRERDSLANGLWIGLAIGVAGGLLSPAFSCGGFNDTECSVIVRAVFVPIGAGVGLAAGGLVDRAIRRPVLVYSPGGFGISFRF